MPIFVGMSNSRRPNVVLFFTDQQRHDASSLHGNPLDIMPNFDRLASHGTHAYHSFTCAPVCGPARCCLQTGTYISTNGGFSNGCTLPDHLPTMAQCFNDAGYHTGYIGKWHLANVKHTKTDGGLVPKDMRGGYKEWLGVEALEFSVDEYHTTLYDTDDKPVKLPGYRVDAMTDAGIRFIDNHQDEPFFLMLSYIEPHHQNHVDDYPPPVGYREKYSGKWTPPDLAALPSVGGQNAVGGTAQHHLGGYWGMVKRLDEALGRIQDALISLGLDENTIVCFTSDHACHFKTRNGEYKRSCHDSSIRVPTGLWGGPFNGGGTVKQMVSLVDIPPTLLDACGIDVPQTMEGRSVRSVLGGRNDPEWPEEAYIQICDAHVGRAVRTARWKYCVMSEQTSQRVGTDWDKAEYTETFLYDLKYDPHELTNLINKQSHSEVRRVMRERLLKRARAIGEPEPKIKQVENLVPGGQRYVTEEELYQ
jgi:arylsulfatase A-like enzyme